MKVFVLGATGSIGEGLVKELLKKGHKVLGLSRSEAAEEKLKDSNVIPITGDLNNPQLWIHQAIDSDVLIHVASTFDNDMEIIDKNLVNLLDIELNKTGKTLRFIYTGGCWLYGATGDHVATENTPFKPLQAYQWMVEFCQYILGLDSLQTAVVHPAMVYHQQGGVFENFLSDALSNHELEVWGSAKTRWPLIERSDLAKGYGVLLDHPDLVGHFNLVAEQGVWVGDIANSFITAFAMTKPLKELSMDDLIEEYGDWVEGYGLDQQMSAEKFTAATGWRAEIKDYKSSELFKSKE